MSIEFKYTYKYSNGPTEENLCLIILAFIESFNNIAFIINVILIQRIS